MLNYNKNLKKRAQELRTRSTLGEVLLWKYLKNKKLSGLQFYRQKSIGNYIVDFYCKELKLAIEIDGSSHNAKVQEDIFRQENLEALGIIFLRFTEADVRNNMGSILQMIKEKVTSPHLS
jgi:very-short-patch-repair endonuclease